jgi:hypothetical protein
VVSIVVDCEPRPPLFIFVERRIIVMGAEQQPPNNRVRIGILIASILFGVAWAVITLLLGKE